MSDPVQPFDAPNRPRIVFAAGALARIGEFAREAGGRRALLVTDPGIVAAGHAERALAALAAAGIEAVVYDRVRENPTTADVDACLALAARSSIDVIVGLGGGSAMDTAKGCNFLLTNGGRMQDYRGIGKARKPMLPLIAVPTTAGTGSECQSFALIADQDTHEKMACGDAKAAPRVAVLDPALTTTQPRSVTACTGLDALTHAVECAVTRKRNPLSSLFAREAFALVQANLPLVLAQPHDLAARGSMQLGAAWAGIAIENSMLGAAHAAGNPLTARFAVVHGHAVALMLPAVVRYNAVDAEARAAYAALAVHAGLGRADDPAGAVAALERRLRELLALAGIPALSTFGIPADAIPALARDAAGQWTAGFNPRPIAEDGFRALYQQALAGGAAGSAA